VLRELSFSGGALALAASLTQQWRERGTHILATIARYFIAIAVPFYSFEQFLHGDHVPAVPLQKMMPDYVYGHAIWTYVTAAVFAVAGVLLLVGKKTAQPHLAGCDRALRGAGRLCADRGSGTRQPRGI